MQSVEIKRIYTFDEFAEKYIINLIKVVNYIPKPDMRKIVKRLVSMQTEETKQMLLETYKGFNPKTERQIVNIIARSVELYRFDKTKD